MELAVAYPITLVAAGVVAAVTLVLYRSVLLLSLYYTYGSDLMFYSCRILVSPFRLLSSHGLKGPHPLPITGNYRRIKEVNENVLCRTFGLDYSCIFLW